MKLHKNQTLHFSPISMIPGTWNFTKIRHFTFLEFPWSRIHETSQKSDPSIFSNFHDPGYMKIHKNQTLQFSPIFMTPGTWKSTKIRHFNFLQFSWPGTWKFKKNDPVHLYGYMKTGLGSWKLMKIEVFDFNEFSCTRVMKIGENWSVWFLWIFVYPGSWKLEKIEVFDFYEFSCTRGHENWRNSAAEPNSKSTAPIPNLNTPFHIKAFLKASKKPSKVQKCQYLIKT